MLDYPRGRGAAGRSPRRYTFPWEGRRRSGHFRSPRRELGRLYDFANPADQTVVYCASSHTWFRARTCWVESRCGTTTARGPSGALRASAAEETNWYPSVTAPATCPRRWQRVVSDLPSPGSEQAEAVAGIRQRAAGSRRSSHLDRLGCDLTVVNRAGDLLVSVSARRRAPATRGFASTAGLDEQPAADILAVPGFLPSWVWLP